MIRLLDRERARGLVPVAFFGGLALLYFVWARLVVIELWSFSPIAVYGFPFRIGYEGYSRWDAAWYVDIATRGYYYDGPGLQSSVAYFPGYPAAIRIVGRVITDLVQAGMLITVVAGGTFVVAVHRWARRMFDARVATAGVVVLLLWPYAYYLYGVVYSDALFLALAALAFLALERKNPWLAAIIGAVAVATRPVGVAVTVGLVIRSLEMDGVVRTRWSDEGVRLVELDMSKFRLRTLAPLASIGGLVVYCAYLWYRFGDPFAFTHVGGAEGWNRGLQLRTILKGGYVDVVRRGELTVELLTLTVSALATLVALALTVRVLRRLGLGYAAYCAVAVVLPLLTSPEFRGLGRYVLAAFPCFVAAAERIVDAPKAVRYGAAFAEFLALGLFATYFIRGYYMA